LDLSFEEERMDVRRVGPGVVVRQSRPPDFAIHLARREPVAPVPTGMHLLRLPRPAHGPVWLQFALSSLYLPAQFGQVPWELAVQGAEGGVNRLWTTDTETGLSMPHDARERIAVDEVLRAKVLVTPEKIGLPFETDLFGETAWRVLTRIPAEDVFGAVASWALNVEIHGESLSLAIAHAMQLPGHLGDRLLNLAAAGEVILNHDCLRWIAREAAAGAAAGTWATTAAAPIAVDLGHQSIAAVLFPCLALGTVPTPVEVLRAVWVLHQVYRFYDSAHARYPDNHDAALTALTVMVSLQPQRGAWAARLERWRTIFATPDSEPLVGKAKLTPSAFRHTFQSKVGLTLDEWLAFAWFTSMRYMVRAQQPGGRMLMSIPQLLGEGLVTPLGPTFEGALRTHLLTTFADFGAAVLAENPGYVGIGSVTTTDSLAARNSPLVDVGQRGVAPLGLHSLSTRAVELPRSIVARAPGSGGVREVNSLLGFCFEAYVGDVACRARGRHQVLTGQDIDAVVAAGSSRCDALVAYQHEQLFVEAGLQTLRTGIALGDVAEIRDKCARYHRKADQADATRKYLGELAARYGLLAGTGITALVVTDVPVPLTASLFDELQRQRPDRNPLFLVSIDEFEQLTESGGVFSIPGVVASWQSTGRRVPLLVHLAELRKSFPTPVRHPPSDAATWIARLGAALAA
jgi:hypothetical protein